MKRLWFILVSTILGMAGGQGKVAGKAPRRFGLPILSVTANLKNFSLKNLSFLLLLPILSLGYGENSWLFQLTNSDTLTRLIYGSLLSMPFLFWGIKRWVVSLILLVGAFQIHAGSLGHFFGMDVLVEDLLRYGVLSLLLSFAIFSKKTV